MVGSGKGGGWVGVGRVVDGWVGGWMGGWGVGRAWEVGGWVGGWVGGGAMNLARCLRTLRG